MGDQYVEVVHSYVAARHFQVWLYDVSHSQPQLRSVKVSTRATRVDVLFKDVRLMQLPTSMDGLTIHQIDNGFVLKGSGWEGSRRGWRVLVAEDEGEYSDPSPFTASLRRDQ